MFSNIANYLRGVNSNQGVQDEVLSVDAEVGPALCEGVSNCEYNAVDTDDDWVLVNKSEASATQGSMECVVPLTHSMPQQSATEGRPLRRSPSSSSLPSSLEESWFLTPPPCFTSTGPVHMETSSLENLLIEHPSMSVYQQRTPLHPQPSSAPTPPPIEIVACESVAEFHEEGTEAAASGELVLSGSLVLVVAPSAAQEARGTSTALSRRGGATANVSSHIESDQHRALQMRSAQKIQQKRACQVLKRGQLDRNNKARELNSRNKIQRRSDRMLHHSGANNNRKC